MLNIDHCNYIERDHINMTEQRVVYSLNEFHQYLEQVCAEDWKTLEFATSVQLPQLLKIAKEKYIRGLSQIVLLDSATVNDVRDRTNGSQAINLSHKAFSIFGITFISDKHIPMLNDLTKGTLVYFVAEARTFQSSSSTTELHFEVWPPLYNIPITLVLVDISTTPILLENVKSPVPHGPPGARKAFRNLDLIAPVPNKTVEVDKPPEPPAAMAEQDFFDCGPSSFYNCRVPKTNQISAGILRNCPVCGHAEAPEHFRKGELRLARCGRCGMIHANPAPAEFASGKYYDQAGADYYLSPAKLESDYAAVRFERELRLFRSHCLRGAVLDVGCSSGAFLFQLNQRFPGCYNILGTDVSGAPLDYAESRGVPVLRGDFPGQDFGGKQFAAVTCWAVIEHLLEPRQFLDKAWSILEPNGLCFVLVPNMRSLAARLLGARYRYVYPQHLNYFTKATLTQLVETRFSVIDFRSTHFNPLVIWQDWRGGGKEVANRERADLLKRTTAYKENPRLRPVKVLYKIVERTLGRLTLADNLAVVLRAKTVTRKSYGNAED